MLIPDNVLDKIKYLCKEFPELEWSGVLFYSVEGTIKDTKNMKITLRDIYLMDVGTKAATEFDWNEEVVAYQMENPETMEWIWGHIHSHNSMKVFFSGVDDDELATNCKNFNYYLSVVVNNYLDVIAKIASVAEQKKFVCKDEDGNDYTLSLSNSTLKPIMMLYNCIPQMSNQEITVPESFVNRASELEERKINRDKETAKKREEYKAKQTTKVTNQKGIEFKGGNSSVAPFPDYSGKNFREPLYNGYPTSHDYEEEEEDILEGWSVPTLNEEFATYVLRLGNPLPGDNIIDAIEDIDSLIEKNEISATDIILSIRERYGVFHTSFFDKFTYRDDDKKFLEILSEVIGIYEEHESDFSFLSEIIVGLKELGLRFEHTLKQQEI